MSKIAMTLTSKNLILIFLVNRDRGRRSGEKGAGGVREVYGRYTGVEGRGGRKSEK